MKLAHIRIGTINRHIFIYFKATIIYFNTLAIQFIFVSLICPTIPVTMLCFNDAKPLFSLWIQFTIHNVENYRSVETNISKIENFIFKPNFCCFNFITNYFLARKHLMCETDAS